jgi:glycosyltransferase involved in cell wall biosynthesis
MRLAVVIPFLNEQQLLPQLLGSIATQTRPPDWLLLVDDGSTDSSPAIAAEFVREHGYASLARRAVRAGDDDRLRDAHELRAFEWALSALEEPWDVVAKLDADLRLPPGTFADVLARFERDPRLGIAGPRLLSVDHDGRDVSHAPARSTSRARRGSTGDLVCRRSRRFRRSSAGTRSTRSGRGCAVGTPPAAAAPTSPCCTCAPWARTTERSAPFGDGGPVRTATASIPCMCFSRASGG